MKNSVVQPEGNYYDKYHSTNPIVKWMTKNFFISIDSMLSVVGDAKHILEAGCSESEVTNFVSLKYGSSSTIEIFDVSEKVILAASTKYPSIKFSTGDIYNISA